MIETILFIVLAAGAVITALMVILQRNPYFWCVDKEGNQLSIHDSQFITDFGDESSPSGTNSTNPPATADSPR